MTEMTRAQRRYFEGKVKPYVEGVYSTLEAELDYWNSDEVQELRMNPQRYETVGDMLRLKKVAAIGSSELLLSNDAIVELSGQANIQGVISDMYLNAVREVFASHTNIEGLKFWFAANAGILVKKA